METIAKTFSQIFESANHVVSAPANWITNWIKNMTQTLYLYLVVIAIIALGIMFIYCAMQYYCASTANKWFLPITNIMNMFKFPKIMLDKKETKNKTINGTNNKTINGTFQWPPTNFSYIIPMQNGDQKKIEAQNNEQELTFSFVVW
jgi:type IV secretory pathway VirB2 component (pilin)